MTPTEPAGITPHSKRRIVAKVDAAHMCRDGHDEIYYNESEHELCPVCRMRNERDAARSVPAQGMVMVPREPSEEMLVAGFIEMDENLAVTGDEGLCKVYRAMIAASQEKPE